MKLLLLVLDAQIQGPFQVVNHYGTYLIPQGISKTDPRSYSVADPNNPYRKPKSRILALPARSYLDMSDRPRQREFPATPTGKTVIASTALGQTLFTVCSSHASVAFKSFCRSIGLRNFTFGSSNQTFQLLAWLRPNGSGRNSLPNCLL